MGIGPCAYTSQIEARLGPADLFDFGTGTSIGAVDTALTIGCGMLEKSVYEIHQDHGESVFADRNLLYRTLKIGPQFDDSVIVGLLKEHCGDRTMSETEKPVYLTAYDARNRRLKVFGPRDKDVPLWYAARCSMAATTYFSMQERRLCDGGFTANDPALVGWAGYVNDVLDGVIPGVSESDLKAGFKILELVTSGTTPDIGPLSNSWPIWTSLTKVILPSITAGNSSDVEYLLRTVGRYLKVFVAEDKLKLFRVAPETPDWDLAAVENSGSCAGIWTKKFQEDQDKILEFLA